MAKITEFKNPLQSKEGSIFDLSQWTGGILWVVMVGLVLAVGVTLVQKIDAVLPGSQTPNIKPYSKMDTGSGIQTL